jgi:hypothetical protein
MYCTEHTRLPETQAQFCPNSRRNTPEASKTRVQIITFYDYSLILTLCEKDTKPVFHLKSRIFEFLLWFNSPSWSSHPHY